MESYFFLGTGVSNYINWKRGRKSPSMTLSLRNLTTVKTHVIGANTNFPGFRVYGCLRTTYFIIIIFFFAKKSLSTGSHFWCERLFFTSKMLSRSYGGLQLLVRRQSYLANMTNSSLFNWRFWSYEKFCVSHTLTRLQKWKIGDYKFFNFFVNTKLYFSSQCEQGLSLATCRPFTTTPEGMSGPKAVHLENYCRLTYLR